MIFDGADLVGQLSRDGQEEMLQIDAPRLKFLATPLADTAG